MRDYLQAKSVEFDDLNIRHNEEARSQLLRLTSDLVVPLVVFGDLQVTGFDPDGLNTIVDAYHGTMSR